MTITEGQERLAEAILKPVNPVGIILLGFFTVVWGFWVGNPFWDAFATDAVFESMGFMSEVCWGIIAGAVGIVVSHGAISRRLANLILGAQVGAIYWFVVAVMFFIGDWQNPGGITTMILAIYSTFIYLNLKVNSKESTEHKHLFTH